MQVPPQVQKGPVSCSGVTLGGAGAMLLYVASITAVFKHMVTEVGAAGGAGVWSMRGGVRGRHEAPSEA